MNISKYFMNIFLCISMLVLSCSTTNKDEYTLLKYNVDSLLTKDITNLDTDIQRNNDRFKPEYNKHSILLNNETLTPFNGTIFQMKDTIVINRGPIKRGLRHGIWRLYDTKGFLEKKCLYSNGVLNGWCELYDNETKKICVRGFYKNDSRDSIWMGISDAGDTLSYSKYEQGEKEGLWVNLSNKGDTLSYTNYTLGKKDGVSTEYGGIQMVMLKNTNSFFQYETMYRNGLQYGVWGIDSTGKRERIDTYIDIKTIKNARMLQLDNLSDDESIEVVYRQRSCCGDYYKTLVFSKSHLKVLQKGCKPLDKEIPDSLRTNINILFEAMITGMGKNPDDNGEAICDVSVKFSLKKKTKVLEKFTIILLNNGSYHEVANGVSLHSLSRDENFKLRHHQK